MAIVKFLQKERLGSTRYEIGMVAEIEDGLARNLATRGIVSITSGLVMEDNDPTPRVRNIPPPQIFLKQPPADDEDEEDVPDEE